MEILGFYLGESVIIFVVVGVDVNMVALTIKYVHVHGLQMLGFLEKLLSSTFSNLNFGQIPQCCPGMGLETGFSGETCQRKLDRCHWEVAE